MVVSWRPWIGIEKSNMTMVVVQALFAYFRRPGQSQRIKQLLAMVLTGVEVHDSTRVVDVRPVNLYNESWAERQVVGSFFQ